ncbi:sigma-70 family RNA polymerase sigma factor [Pseudoroseomonas globiformis]|uniref:RNA polymerase sigma factor n=1 Tax=Teichococcus globiformis TaxID=2307229 RepID=A0ABV7G302_9PROT
MEEKAAPLRMLRMGLGWKRFDVTAHLGVLQRYAWALTRHAADAEDLVQTALLRAYDRRAGFQPGQDLAAWLLAILHNAFIDGWRSRASEQARIAALGTLAVEHAGPAQEHALELGRIHRAYLSLPEDQRAAFHLVALEGLSYGQAAEILNVPAGTVMSRVSRVRAGLRHAEQPVPADHRPSLRIVGASHDPDR